MFDSADHTAPAVSVVMPVYNAERFLTEAIASVRGQDWTDWELIAVDDGSTDASCNILARMAALDPRIRVLHSGGNHGAGVARNMAMDTARGRFLAFLDADDVWHPQKLSRHLRWLHVHPVALSFTAYLREDTVSGRVEDIGVPAQVSYRQLLATNVIGCSTVMLDRELLGECRMPVWRLRQDFGFWLTILQRHGPAAGLPLTLTTYRRHANSVSGRKLAAARATWIMYRHALGLSHLQAGWYFSSYAFRGAMRHYAPALARRLGYLHASSQPD